MTLVIRSSQRIDGQRMLRVVESLLVDEPILSAQMRHSGDWLEWIQDPDVTAEDILMEHTDHDGDDERFCYGRFDLHKAPLWRVDLAHGVEDTLAVSLAHAMGDGRSLLILVDRILRLYVDPTEPEPKASMPDRSVAQVMRPGESASSRLQDPTAIWPTLYEGTTHDEGRLMMRRIPPEEFLRLRKEWKRKHSATVNDILLAAFALSLRDLTGSGEHAVVSATVDNRQYASGKVTDIGNFSTNYALPLGDVRGMDMPEAVKAVKGQMDILKETGGLGREDLELFNKLTTVDQVDSVIDVMYSSSREGEAMYFITNVGDIRWNDAVSSRMRITDSYMTYPGIKPPTIGVVVSSFNGCLNLNFGCYEGLPIAKARELLDTIVRHLSSI